MGLFSSKKKPDIGAQYQEPPQRTYDINEYNRYKAGYNTLTDTFEKRSRGEDIFDYIKFLFEPQKTALLQDYGLTGDPNDVYSNRTGTLPTTLASLNSRGLLDSGTSGVVEGQLRSNANNKVAELFGNAKQLQRQDIDDALDALHTLYPENFEIADIPHSIAYGNALNSYNVASQRNAAQQAYEASQGPKTFFGQIAPQLGQAAGTAIGGYFGGPIGAQVGGQLGGTFGNAVGGGGGYAYNQNQAANNGGFNFDFLKNIVGGNSAQSKSSGVTDSAPGVGSYYSNYYKPINSRNDVSGNIFSASYGGF